MSNQPLFTPRPIKYRAWDGKKMLTVHSLCWNRQGYLWYGAGNQFGWAYVYPDSDGWSAENQKPSENDIRPVMQWTGLTDDKGIDIYDGDIVRLLETDFYHERDSSADKVGDWWENVLVVNNGLMFKLRLNQYRADEPFDFTQRIEVVGNVFEHPDLLKS